MSKMGHILVWSQYCAQNSPFVTQQLRRPTKETWCPPMRLYVIWFGNDNGYTLPLWCWFLRILKQSTSGPGTSPYDTRKTLLKWFACSFFQCSAAPTRVLTPDTYCTCSERCLLQTWQCGSSPMSCSILKGVSVVRKYVGPPAVNFMTRPRTFNKNKTGNRLIAIWTYEAVFQLLFPTHSTTNRSWSTNWPSMPQTVIVIHCHSNMELRLTIRPHRGEIEKKILSIKKTSVLPIRNKGIGEGERKQALPCVKSNVYSYYSVALYRWRLTFRCCADEAQCSLGIGYNIFGVDLSHLLPVPDPLGSSGSRKVA